MPTIDTNGIAIHYEINESNSGDLVVLVNGLADDRETWAPQIPALVEAGYRVLTYDNRGIGRTSRPQGPYTATILADDLHGLLQSLGVKQAHLIGISMGGMILQAFALKYPNGTSSGIKMLSLTLACTYARPTEFCSRMFSFWEDVAKSMSVQDVMRDVTLWAFTVPFFRTRTDELSEVEAAMAHLDMQLDEYLAQLHVIQNFDSTSALEALRADEMCLGNLDPSKILILAGKTDILIPVTLSRELCEKIEGSQWKTVKGGHACSLEFPHPFNEALVEFLKECK